MLAKSSIKVFVNEIIAYANCNIRILTNTVTSESHVKLSNNVDICEDHTAQVTHPFLNRILRDHNDSSGVQNQVLEDLKTQLQDAKLALKHEQEIHQQSRVLSNLYHYIACIVFLTKINEGINTGKECGQGMILTTALRYNFGLLCLCLVLNFFLFSD